MVPFLRQVAGRYFDEGGLDRKCLVFPNRRSMVFFRKYLSDIARMAARPLMAPAMVTMIDFFCRLYDGNVTDRVTLLLELYECYRSLNPKAESLDEFIFWGDIILGDFNDADKYLADPKQLFKRLGKGVLFHLFSSLVKFIKSRVFESIKTGASQKSH